MEREACQEKLVGNLQDFLSEFSRNIEYENQEKREVSLHFKAGGVFHSREPNGP